MMGRSHAALGAVAGAVAAGQFAGADRGAMLAWAAVGALAGLAPDLDHPHSTLGRLLPRWWHRLTPGHRGMTHSLVWVVGFGVVLAAVAVALGAGMDVAGTVWLVTVAGAGSHLAADGVTHQGVPWLWPWRGERMTLPDGWTIRTGGVAERVLVALVVAVGVLLGW